MSDSGQVIRSFKSQQYSAAGARIIDGTMGQALYRKNRPKKLSEVVGQEHITSTLENALKKGAISHAYLFTGPRGVGKTSVARILAHEINGLPYTDDSMHLDIIEIDAASNRRIDEIRDLRDRVNTAPTSAKYKVYIIDEVHMLTREAFNALLKTLEEPPAHVVFILATTESHKLPETIVSRTQRFMFKPVALDKVVEHLKAIATQEKIDISDDALELVARHGEGSFRDSISLLDQAAGHNGKIDAAYIQSMIGIPPREAVESLAVALTEHDSAKVVNSLAQMQGQGFGASHIARQLGSVWRERLLNSDLHSQREFDLLTKLLDVPSSHDPARYLEIILLEYALSGDQMRAQPAKPKSTTENPPEKKNPEPTIATEPETKTDKPKSQITHKTAAVTVTKTEAELSPLDGSAWQKVLAELKKKHNTLYGVVRMAQPEFKPGKVVLGFSFAFHRKRLSEKKNQQIIAAIIKDVTGQAVTIECVESSQKTHTSSTVPDVSEKITEVRSDKNTEADLASISTIFGGGEILES